MKLIFKMASFHPTQGQWYDDLCNDNVQRRVSLTGAIKGYGLWTANFRTKENLNVWPPESKHICSKFFITRIGETSPLAFFETLQDRDKWLDQQSNPYEVRK